jgi:hypothetical protein
VERCVFDSEHNVYDTSTCSDIAGATGATYIVTAANVGSPLAVIVTATNSHGSTSEYAAWEPYPFLDLISPGIVAAPNLLPNGDGEARPGGYYTNGVGTFTWATDKSSSPTHSLKIVSACECARALDE